MGSRLDLQDKLIELIGNNHVYFQPPESVKLQFPCIIYNLDSGDTQFAMDLPYTFTRRYEIMFITKDPDSELIDKIAKAFPMIRFDRSYCTDNLNHYTYKLYY
jgi:hypothetical protein